MNILVTGCFGFIGFNFVKYILKKPDNSIKITGVDNLNNAYSVINFENQTIRTKVTRLCMLRSIVI